MKKTLLTVAIIGISIQLIAQEKPAKPFTQSVSGFVKNDMYKDTRETVNARDGHFLLWPAPALLDSTGHDINDIESFNILAIQSRITYKFAGPDVLGAKVSGLMEGDFFGNSNTTINSFRLRHAFAKLNWDNTEIISGQYWHPFFVTSCFPGTLSFNTGTPFNSFARNPQVRLTHKIDKISIMFAGLSQVDNTSRGIGSTAGTSYLRNAEIPEFHAQIQFETKNDSLKTAFLLGGGVGFKTIEPRVSSTNLGKVYKVEEEVGGLSAIGFTKITTEPITLKLHVRYGENIPDVTAPGGFAVKEVIDTITGECAYTPLKSMSYWGEIHTNGKNWEIGVFGGIYTNTGTKETMSDASNAVYGLATNIASMYRVSPRVIYKINKFSVGAEVEYTSALYGEKYNTNYVPANTNEIN
ncbi:MAG TPA: hypothetical protein PK734_00325, partial [Bacteroidales bacterium]|nr:hypothetical protein [Bacteroidales bacterium]